MKDFEFIKNKFDESGVNAPDSLGEQFVLDSTSETKVPEPKPKKKKYVKYSALAASVALIALAAFSINIFRPAAPVYEVKKAEAKGGSALAEVRSFNSYAELKDTLDKIDERNKTFYYAEDAGISYGSMDDSAAAAAPGSTSKSASSHSETYKQVDGVDEADTVKTDGRYIYCVDYVNEAVRIFSAKGKKSERVTSVYPRDAESATPDEAKKKAYDDEIDVCDIFINDNRLIVISNYYDTDSEKTDTRALVYDVTDVENIRLLDEFTQSGDYCSSRMIGDTLYLVSNYEVGKKSKLPKCGRGSSPKKLALDYCYTVEKPTSKNFLVVSSLNTADSTHETQSKAILGSADTVYCNENNMYVTAEQWDEETYKKAAMDALMGYVYNPVNVNTQIVKINLTDGIKIIASAKVKGTIDSQYSLDEYDDNLRVATTSQNKKGKDENNLFILSSKLRPLSSVQGFARDEHIEAVRYVGSTAYVITYEETDPLFIIDLSNVKKPEILGEAKITGFSTMLVPIDDNTILGLGYHTEEEDWADLEVKEGFKLALFDVSDKKNPKVLDSKIYANYYSEVQYNPKALVYNADRNDFVIPYDYSGDYDEDYCGMINFKVENGKIKEIDQRKADLDSVDRCLYVEDTVYMIGRFGMPTIDSVKYK
ncbi:MAG: beta-propeller domain-containing protein [Ruminococcus sp.]|nr:beta-propeller domain-containing protein [Ruminococcus sp.]